MAAVGTLLIGKYTSDPTQQKSLNALRKIVLEHPRTAKMAFPHSPPAPPLLRASSPRARPLVHVCFTACGLVYSGHAINVIRSVHLSSLLHGYAAVVHILSDGLGAARILEAELNTMHKLHLTRLKFHFVTVADPSENSTGTWVSRFRCASSRLQLAELLPTVAGVVVYIDVDTYVTGNLAELVQWVSSNFNETQWAGMVSESEDEGGGWYASNMSLGMPFYEPRGLNSGVWVVNLTRCRQTVFTDFARTESPKIFKRHAFSRYILPDQDFLNFYFHSRRQELLILPCKWNLRLGSGCNQLDHLAASNGIVHGNREHLFTPHANSMKAYPDDSLLFLEVGRFLIGSYPRWGVSEAFRHRYAVTAKDTERGL